MKILSVDDSTMIRKVIRGVVEVIGYDLLEARDGVEGLEVLEKNYEDISMVLLDWNMPRMDGYVCLQEIMKDERYKDIPVVMVTTEVERGKIAKAIEAGAKNYVMKPFSQEDLIAKIMESLGMGI